MRYFFSISALLVLWMPAAGQPLADTLSGVSATEAVSVAENRSPAPMTLNDCMSYAVEHSPLVRQQDYTNANYRQDFISSVAALVPSVGGSVGSSASFGRSVNPETNTYTDVSNFSNSYSVSSQMPVFGGFAGINTLRASKVMRLMGVEELQQVKDQVALKTMQAYFDVVYYTGSVRLAQEKLAASMASVVLSRKQLELGLKSAADLAEVESLEASDDYLLTQQENNLALAELTLAQTMNYPSDKLLEVDTEVLIETPAGSSPLEEVLCYALDNHPLAEASAHKLRYSELNYSVSKGRLYPSISMGGGYSTNFFMNLNNRSQYASFHNQFRDNRGYYVSANLSVPIFGGLSRRTSVNRARNSMHIAEQQREQTLSTLRDEVSQAYQQMLGSGKEFVQATKKSTATELAYKAVEAKYERGMVSALDLQTSSNNWLQARSECLRTRLQYIVKTRLVEYYNGVSLIR